MKIRQVVSRVIPCGRTDVTKLIVGFRNFAIRVAGLEGTRSKPVIFHTAVTNVIHWSPTYS